MENTAIEDESLRSLPAAQPRGAAPISCLFKECLSLFDQIAIHPAARGSARFDHTGLQATKFRTWGNETGSFTFELDRSLRKASRLQQHVLMLLNYLRNDLQKVLGTDRNSMKVTNSTNIENAIATDEALPLQEMSQSNSDSIQDTVITDSIEDLLLCLSALVPALRDPAPQDTYQEHAVTKDELKDLDLAMLMFPKATPRLIRRLGHANWKRRCFQRCLKDKWAQHQQLETNTFQSPSPSISIPDKDISRLGSTVLSYQPLITSSSKNRTQPKRTLFSESSSLSGLLSTSPGTMFSQESFKTGLSTISSILSDVKVTGNCHNVPNPPVSFQSKEEFICPYCLQHLVVGEDIEDFEDWEYHVFSDLEPYMCTYDDCIRAEKTFGEREEWFRHELDSHRIANVWFCQSCVKEFDESSELAEHLKSEHGYQQGQELAIIVAMCRRRSQAPVLNQSCAICHFICSDAEVLKSHVAVHFEQHSLTSITLEDDATHDADYQQQDGNSPENEEKKRRLESFLSELRDNAFAKALEDDREDRNVSATSDSGLLPESSDDASFGHDHEIAAFPSSSKTGSRGKTEMKAEPYHTKVERYLDEQARTFYDAPESDITSLKSYDVMSESMIEPLGPMETLRSIRTMPPTRNQAFVGRDSDFDKLHENLNQVGSISVLSGAGGIGKSATAIEYTYKFEREYAYIFWIQAETPVSCAYSYGHIATHLGLDSDEVVRHQERLVMLSRDFLERTGKRWLLVFDNVDDLAAVKRLLPSKLLETRGSILITTRNANILPKSIDHTRMELGTLAMEDCRRLLLTSTGENPKDMRTHPEYKLAGDIAIYAGRLPLALSHIAGYLAQSGCSLEDFVELWQERLRHTTLHALAKDGSTLNSTEKTLEIMWNIGLREVTIDARELLHILAFFDSDTIQKDLLVDEHHERSLEFLHSSERFRYKRMTSELARRRLIAIKTEDGQDTLSIHRALQLKILKDLDNDPQNRDKVFRQAYMLVRKKFPEPSPIQVPEPKKWPKYIKYIPHILSLRKAYMDSIITLSPSVEFARLLADGGTSLWERALTSESLPLLEAAEFVLNSLGCQEDMLRANIDIIISIVIQGQGVARIPESLDRLRNARSARLRHQAQTPPELYTKNDEMLLCNAQSDFAYCLLQQNNYVQAEPLFNDCLKKYREWGTEKEVPYEYSKYNLAMGLCSMYRRDFGAAIVFADRSVYLMHLATGDSPTTYSWKFNKACILLQSGDLKRALDVHSEVLDWRVRQHGTTSYWTAISYYAVGALHGLTGNLPLAESYMRKALGSDSIRRENHPEIAVARVEFHLSQILRQQEKCPEEAQELEVRSRSVLHKLLPLSPLDGVPEKHELVLFDHLQPLFSGARFTGRDLLQYVK